jgi:hypothetical protein
MNGVAVLFDVSKHNKNDGKERNMTDLFEINKLNITYQISIWGDPWW